MALIMHKKQKFTHDSLLVVRKSQSGRFMSDDDDDEISPTPTITLEVVKQQLRKPGILKFVWHSIILKELAGELPRQLILIFQ